MSSLSRYWLQKYRACSITAMLPLFPDSAEQTIKFKRVNQGFPGNINKTLCRNGIVLVNVP